MVSVYKKTLVKFSFSSSFSRCPAALCPVARARCHRRCRPRPSSPPPLPRATSRRHRPPHRATPTPSPPRSTAAPTSPPRRHRCPASPRRRPCPTRHRLCLRPAPTPPRARCRRRSGEAPRRLPRPVHPRGRSSAAAPIPAGDLDPSPRCEPLPPPLSFSLPSPHAIRKLHRQPSSPSPTTAAYFSFFLLRCMYVCMFTV